MTATVGAGVASSRSSTSVVVPDRQIASTLSYARPCGNSDAANASVSPRPADSRSAAYDCAMNSDVPQPTTATRSPVLGSSETAPPISIARSQHAGWLAISSETNVIPHPLRSNSLTLNAQRIDVSSNAQE